MKIIKPLFINEDNVMSTLLGKNIETVAYFDGSLESLLNIYKNNRTTYFDIVDEMVLRGYFFEDLKENSPIKNFETDSTVFITISADHAAYKRIDYALLGLSGFIPRFKVKSDYFFESIPLSNFKYLNSKLNLSILKNELERVGFALGYSTQDRVTINEEVIPIENESESCEFFFAENKFNLFRSFCRHYQLESIYDITEEYLDLFKEQKGVGFSRFKEVASRLKEKNIFRAKEELETTFITDHYYSQQLIESFEKLAKEVTFISYCQSIKVEKLGQLTNKNIEGYQKCRGVGIGRYNRILMSIKDLAEEQYDPIFRLKDSYSSSVRALPIKEIVNLLEISQIPLNPYETLNDVVGINITKRDDYLFLITLQEELAVRDTPLNMINSFWEELNEEEQDILNQRFSLKRTLEEIGSQYKVTRERIRQKESRILKKFEFSLKPNILITGMIFQFNSRIISVEKLKNYFTNDLFYFLAKRAFKKFEIERLHLYIFSSVEETRRIEKEIQDYLARLPYILTKTEASESYSAFWEVLELGEEQPYSLADFYRDAGYRDYKQYYCIGKISRKSIYQIIIESDFDNYLEVNEETITNIKEIVSEKFEVFLDNLTIKNVEARVLDIENIIQLDSHIFSIHNPKDIPEVMIIEWQHFIENELVTKSIITNFDIIFDHFKNSLKMIGVYTKIHFYSLVKIYFNDDFTIGRGNTLSITSKDKIIRSLPTQLTNKIIANQGLIRKSDLFQEEWKPYQLDQVLQRSNELLSWDDDIIHVTLLKLTEDEMAVITKVIIEVFVDGYSSVTNVKLKLLLNKQTNEMIKKINCLKTPRQWNSFIRYCCPQVKGGYDYLFLEDSGFESFTNLVLDKLDDEITRSQVLKLTQKLSISENNVETVMKRLNGSPDYIEVSHNIFKRYETLEITEEQEEEVCQFFEAVNARNNGLVIVNQIIEGEIPLPTINENWTLLLIHSMGQRFGYIVPEKEVADYRIDMLLLADPTLKLDTFTKFLDYYLTISNVLTIHEIDLYKLLQRKGILRKRNYEYEMTIPTEVKSDSQRFEYDLVTKYFRLKV